MASSTVNSQYLNNFYKQADHFLTVNELWCNYNSIRSDVNVLQTFIRIFWYNMFRIRKLVILDKISLDNDFIDICSDHQRIFLTIDRETRSWNRIYLNFASPLPSHEFLLVLMCLWNSKLFKKYIWNVFPVVRCQKKKAQVAISLQEANGNLLSDTPLPWTSITLSIIICLIIWIFLCEHGILLYYFFVCWFNPTICRSYSKNIIINYVFGLFPGNRWNEFKSVRQRRGV